MWNSGNINKAGKKFRFFIERLHTSSKNTFISWYRQDGIMPFRHIAREKFFYSYIDIQKSIFRKVGYSKTTGA